ncbi:MAG: type II toxin-antitoxin system RelE/ParE family toxin [Alphaproteobacteria bacterium]|jgi:toxin ParE1/3/4
MRTWTLSAVAKASLVDIYEYTTRKWGQKQADKYLDGLFRVFERIPERKVPWRPIPEEFEVKGYCYRYRPHYIYWRRFPDGHVGITAILHASMMHGERLATAFGLEEGDGE